MKIQPKYQPTEDEKLLLERWPDLITLHHSKWEQAAQHLDDAAAARRAGLPCPRCPAPTTTFKPPTMYRVSSVNVSAHMTLKQIGDWIDARPDEVLEVRKA